MASFNKVILMGRLCADPELKQTSGGLPVTSFSLVVDRKGKTGEDKQCDFITVVAWRQTAEFICRYFKKGQAILVCGELQTRSWQDNNGNKRYATEVIASEVSFCGSKNNTEGNSYSAEERTPSPAFQPQTHTPVPDFEEVSSDEDLPF